MNCDILIIDDEEEICDVLFKLIRANTEFRVHTALNADLALEYLSHHVPPLILCDISMPGRNGLELIQEVKRRGHITSVVMLTAHSEKERILEALRLGAIDYVTKPFETRELLKNLRTWIELGERLKRFPSSELEMKNFELIRVKINNDRKNFKG